MGEVTTDAIELVKSAEREIGLNILDPEQHWWVCWRITDKLCGRSLQPFKIAIAMEIAEKCQAVYGKKAVWLEKEE